ncbi:acid protease [Suhomyces tanzawaensis NRRL Y-17324]|uniref:Acid protease n=1 Tax=Suhomyces tanzawaensis NRRL Y-17324 TaxID=984487 RepID=A0A1E4SIR4_9ASCO|nr:acid protease [Suhomyces tanzawaensis NRRL Y-17324]ODV79388.1 acid protease [Suhomyces tanzawaensis NRRL Y-17324]
MDTVQHHKLQDSSRQIPRFTSSDTIPSSLPVFELSDTLQILHTDISTSIFYLQPSIADASNDYNQSFTLLLDTGSPLTWLYNSSCDGMGCDLASMVKFNDSRSIKTDSSFHLEFSDEQIDGELFALDSNNMSFSWGSQALSNFSVGMTKDNLRSFWWFNISGILGIPSSVDPNANTNYLSQLHQQDLIDKEQFGLYFLPYSSQSPRAIKHVDSNNKSSPVPSTYGGLIAYGSEAEKMVQKFTSSSEMFYVDVADQASSYWLVNATNIKAANSSNVAQTFNESSDSKQFVIDTGTTGLALPPSDAYHLHQLMFGSKFINDTSGNFAFPCNSSGSVLFNIDEKEFNITAADIEGVAYQDDLDGYCASMVQGKAPAANWVLGVAFLKNYYTIFDVKERRIGLGNINLTSYVLADAGSNSSASSNSSGGSASSSASSSTSSSSSSSSSSSNSTRTDGDKKNNSGKIQAGLIVPGVALGIMIAMI